MCTMHQYMNLCPPGCLCLFHLPMHSLMETWVPLYVSVCLCPSHLISVPPPCLDCVHVHQYMIFMSTLLPKLAQPPMDSYMESLGCAYAYYFLCTSQLTSCLWSHTLFRMCTWINTWIYVNLTGHICSNSCMYSFMETLGTPVWQCVCGQVTLHFCCWHHV